MNRPHPPFKFGEICAFKRAFLLSGKKKRGKGGESPENPPQIEDD
jgi:hypothetical protein